MPKRIAMVRKTGMKVFEKQFRSVVPFCGIFLCRNDRGNELLRDMEPPRHDTWDPDHPEKGLNKKTEAEYVSFIRECVKELVPVDESKVVSIPGLNRYLPDDEESPEESFEGASTENSKSESAIRNLLPEQIPGSRIDPRKRTMQPDRSHAGDGIEETESPDPYGDTGGGAGETTNSGGGGDGQGPGSGNGKNATAEGGGDGVQPKPSIPVRYRTYCRDAASGVYALAVEPDKAQNDEATLVVFVVGDDQKVPADIEKARFAAGGDVPVQRGNQVGPVTFPKKGALRLEVVLREPLRVAMEVAAHEA